jgi:hypothetical protein
VESGFKQSPMGAIIFRVNFDLGAGKLPAKINVRENDNFYRLAHTFALQNNLGEEAIQKVYNLLEATKKSHA